jgi:hypothetical protein
MTATRTATRYSSTARVHHHLADGREKFLIFHARPPGVVSLCGDILRDLLEMAPQRARCMPDRAAN